MRRIIAPGVVVLLFLVYLVWTPVDDYYRRTVHISARNQVHRIFISADRYSQKGEKLAAVKLRAIGSILSGENKGNNALLSVEMYSVTTSVYPAEYKKAELIVGEELVNIGEPLMTLLILQIEELSMRKSISEIEGGGACTALRALSLSSKERVKTLLYSILKNGGNNIVTWEATVLAWRLKLPNIEQSLISQVSRFRQWGRQYPVFVLGQLEAHHSQPQILEALDDSSPAVRRHGVMAISKIGDGSALKVLRKLRDEDSDEIVRSLAEKAVLKIEKGLSSLESLVVPVSEP